MPNPRQHNAKIKTIHLQIFDWNAIDLVHVLIFAIEHDINLKWIRDAIIIITSDSEATYIPVTYYIGSRKHFEFSDGNVEMVRGVCIWCRRI